MSVGLTLFRLIPAIEVSTRVSLVAMVIIVANLALAPIEISPNWIMTVVNAVTGLAMRASRANIHLVHERAMHAHTFA